MLKTRTVVLLVIGAVFISASVATAAAGWKVNGTMLYYNNDHVGIGTRHPDKRLSVIGRIRAAFNDNENEYTEIGHGGGNGYINTSGDGDLKFRHNDQNKMSLDDEGNLEIAGGISWGEQEGVISVPAAAFRPMYDGYDYSNEGYRLYNNDGNSDFYTAPVHLPDGAGITKLTFYWRDGSSVNGYCSLLRSSRIETDYLMAQAYTFSDANVPASNYDTTISYPMIDNDQYFYYLTMRLNDSSIIGLGAEIEYEFTRPY